MIRLPASNRCTCIIKLQTVFVVYKLEIVLENIYMHNARQYSNTLVG